VSSTAVAPTTESTIGKQITSQTFACLWAGSHILHAWHKGGSELDQPLMNPWLIAVLVAGFWLLAKPSSASRLALLALVQLTAFTVEFPFVANHWTIAAFVNAGILCSFWIQRRRGAAGIHDVVEHVAPYGRVAFFIGYGAASLAKLNTTFFDPVKSCALALIEPIGTWLGFAVPQDGAGYAVIGGVALVELSIPLLLLAPRTRTIGIILAAVFHLLLAATPVVLVMDFTALILALLALFAPEKIGRRILQEGRALAERWPFLHSIEPHRSLVIYGASGFLLALAIGRGAAFGVSAWVYLTWLVLLMYGALVATIGVFLVCTASRASGSNAAIGAQRRLGPVHAVLVLALLLNASSPYLGLKTTSSFTMFSNLRTEAIGTNHLFLPRLPVRTYQDDLVEVLDSSNPTLAAFAGSGQLITFHEFRRILTDDPNASVSFVRDGTTVSVGAASEEPSLVSLPPLQAKLLHFRSVAADGQPICQA